MKTKNISSAFLLQKTFYTMTRTMYCEKCAMNNHQHNLVLLHGSRSRSFKFRTLKPHDLYRKGYTPHIIRNIMYYHHKERDPSLSYVSCDVFCGVQDCGIVLYGNDNGWIFKVINERKIEMSIGNFDGLKKHKDPYFYV